MGVHPFDSVVRTRDRRNGFAREGLLRAVQRRFEHGGLEITPADAAELFELPPVMCARLLDELVDTGALTRGAEGAYAPSRRAGMLTPASSRVGREP